MDKFSSLLDIDLNTFNVQLFDEALSLLNRTPPLSQLELSQLQSILTGFRNSPDAWILTDKILNNSTSFASKCMITSVLRHNIQIRWPSFSETQKNSLKSFLVSYMLEFCQKNDIVNVQQHSTVITNLNLCIIQILKHDWPNNWKSFIGDLLNTAQKHPGTCYNTISLLKILTEEIFDNESSGLTRQRKLEMKRGLSSEFNVIFNFFQFLLSQQRNEIFDKILIELFTTLAYFLSWIPLGFLFETNLLSMLFNYLSEPLFTPHVFKCINEVVSLKLDLLNSNPNHIKALFGLYKKIILNFGKVPTQYINDTEIYSNLITFITTFLSNPSYLNILEKESSIDEDSANSLKISLNILILFNTFTNETIFKMIIDFLVGFTKELVNINNKVSGPSFFALNNTSTISNIRQKKIDFYGQEFFQKVLELCIRNMLKPKEFIIVDDDDILGPVTMKISESDSLLLFNNIKLIVRNIMTLLPAFTKEFLIDTLDEAHKDLKLINSTSWVIGCLSCILPSEDENKFLKETIRILLRFVINFGQSIEKASVAANIMFICRNYTDYLKGSSNFVQVVIFKLWEFCGEDVPGVKEMAVETLLHISKAINKELIHSTTSATNKMYNPNGRFNGEKFINTVLLNYKGVRDDLEPHNRSVFVESIAYIIKAEENFKLRETYMLTLLKEEIAEWNYIIENSNKSTNYLLSSCGNQTPSIRLANICRTYTNIAGCLGIYFRNIFEEIMTDGCNMYATFVRFFTEKFKAESMQEAATIKLTYADKEKLAFISGFIQLIINFFKKCAEQSVESIHGIIEKYQNIIVEKLFYNYSVLPDECKDSGIISLCSFLVRQNTNMTDIIMNAILRPSVSMINKNFEDYPEHRVALFGMIHNILKFCFTFLDTQSEETRDMIVEILLWGTKHYDSTIVESALQSLLIWNKNIGYVKFEMSFYQKFLIKLILEMLALILVERKEEGKKLIYSYLASLLYIVEGGKLSMLINEEAAKCPNNKIYVANKIKEVLVQAYNNIAENEVNKYISTMFNTCNNDKEFEAIMDDFMIIANQFNI